MMGARTHSSRALILLALVSCAGPIDAEPSQTPPATATPADVAATQPPTSPVDHEKAVRDTIAAYASWGPADSELHWAPGKCDLPDLGNYHESAAPPDATLHGGKLYMVYALDIGRFGRDAWGHQAHGSQIGVHDDPVMAQAIVKATFRPDPDRVPKHQMAVHDPLTGHHGYPPGPIMKDGKPIYAGDPQGLFVMVQLRAGGPETDDGWIYATTDSNGTLTAFGRIAECEGCHRREADRVFGWGGQPKRY